MRDQKIILATTNDAGAVLEKRFSDSLLEPKREVLDLNPGKPHAAGTR